MSKTELHNALVTNQQYDLLYRENDKFHDGIDLMVKLIPAWVAQVASDSLFQEGQKLRSVAETTFGLVEDSLLQVVRATVEEIPDAVAREMVEEVAERVIDIAEEMVEQAIESEAPVVEQDDWPDRFESIREATESTDQYQGFMDEPVAPVKRRRRRTVKGHVVQKAPVKKTAAARKAPAKKTTAKKAAAKKTTKKAVKRTRRY